MRNKKNRKGVMQKPNSRLGKSRHGRSKVYFAYSPHESSCGHQHATFGAAAHCAGNNSQRTGIDWNVDTVKLADNA